MKKYYLLLIAGILSFASLTVSAQTKSAPLTKANAGKIIEMTNAVIDIYNDQLREIKDVRECLERFDNSMEAVSANPKSSAHGASCANIRVLRSDLLEKMQAKAKLAPAFAEKNDILKGMDEVNKEFATVKERCQEIQTYFSTKKYLEDDKDYTNYTTLRDAYIDSYKKISTLFNTTMNLASAAGDRAELVILKTHPLASVVMPMKNNLIAVSQLMNKCRADEPDADAIKADVAAIRKSLEKNKVMTPAIKAALKKSHNGEDRFNRFYEYVGDAMNHADKFLEYLDPNKEITDVDHVLKETVEGARARHMGRQYNEVSKYYGYMVDEYNSL